MVLVSLSFLDDAYCSVEPAPILTSARTFSSGTGSVRPATQIGL
jgi:hypothetical protein